MAYVVTDPCVKCKYTDCVSVCPEECFYEGENFLVIHPEERIDCGACEPVCPTKAIFTEDSVPDQWSEYIELNRDLSTRWPRINRQKDPRPEAEAYKEKTNKRRLLSMMPGPGEVSSMGMNARTP